MEAEYPLTNPTSGLPLMHTQAVWTALALVAAAIPSYGDPDLPDPERHTTVPWKEVGPMTTQVDLKPYRQVYHVSAEKGADKTRHGSREKPYRSIAFALENAVAAKSGRSAVLVAQGHYTGGTLTLKPHVDLFGGYEASGWTRDIYQNRTVLDGAETNRVILGANHARVDGFIITRGQVRGMGAGLLCEGTSPEITNNVFTENLTLAPQPWNPKHLHEIANEGGAIACVFGASPLLEHNLIVSNRTEIGRGAGIACHINASPVIRANVILNNITSIIDPMRSGDGGAISVNDHSHPSIVSNYIGNNESANRNPGGGIFVALWSSAVIRGNILVGNVGGDDGGAIFIGGQEHRYDRPKDPVPSASEFIVRVEENVIMGNSNRGGNSGAMRVAMESRAQVTNNITANNAGGVQFGDSDVLVVNNTFVENLIWRYEKGSLGEARFVNNIIGKRVILETPATFRNSFARQELPGEDNLQGDPRLEDEATHLLALSAEFDSGAYLTQLSIREGNLEPDSLSGRVVRIGTNWSAVKSNDRNSIQIWSAVADTVSSAAPLPVAIMPTYHLKPDSPCIDMGRAEDAPATDFDGDARPLQGGDTLAVDIGADEFRPAE